MKRILAGAVLAILCAGCGAIGSREVAFHDGVKQYAIESGLLDEYDKYIDADSSLDASTKTVRKQSSSGLRKLIATEAAALKEKK